ncbi:hypothetical protein PF050_02250 [Kosakonia pseudosacchari]|uniref:hypothetical protein n=1 Tax=Kosakonia pseudosacchari TaxID=1646340 RepID=UPI0022F0F74E|nr:hypothetical protein [Kosakonia pseudosacchari]WBU49785.1 hypothetical protein PF050_02250 [Kosakonia pseudosacchari]
MTSSKTDRDNDFDRKKGLLQPFYAPLFEQIVRDRNEKNEKTAVRKKDRKKTCAKNWDPYNAPPLTRQRESLHEIVGETKEKKS